VITCYQPVISGHVARAKGSAGASDREAVCRTGPCGMLVTSDGVLTRGSAGVAGVLSEPPKRKKG